MIQLLIPALSAILSKVIDKAVPDKDKAAQLKADATQQLISMDQMELQGAIDIIKAEATGGSWIQQNWRPITMLSFLVLLFMYWFGIAPENLPESTINKLFDLLQIGIGGYIGGRTIEKVAPAIAGVLKKKS